MQVYTKGSQYTKHWHRQNLEIVHECGSFLFKIIYICLFFKHVYSCTMIVLSGIGGQNGASDSLELQVQVIWMSFGTANWIMVLCKNAGLNLWIISSASSYIRTVVLKYLTNLEGLTIHCEVFSEAREINNRCFFRNTSLVWTYPLFRM